MIPIVKICSKKKLTSPDLLIRRNRLKRENTLYLKVVLAKRISMIRRIFALINYAAPRNEHVGIIFRVICPEARHFHSVSENCLFELNKETSCETDKVRK